MVKYRGEKEKGGEYRSMLIYGEYFLVGVGIKLSHHSPPAAATKGSSVL